MEKKKFFDTKPPYSNFSFMTSVPAQRLECDVLFTQNFKENWNVAIDYRRITATMPTHEARKSDSHEKDHYGSATYINVSTDYKGKEGKYRLLGNACLSYNKNKYHL